MSDLFLVTIPTQGVNDGGFIESIHNAKHLYDKEKHEEFSLQELLENVLRNDLCVPQLQWSTLVDDNYIQVQFSVPKDRTEFILNNLVTIGIGDRFGTIWVAPLDVSRPKLKTEFTLEEMSPDQQFAESIKSRMIVEKVVEAAQTAATFSFDYVALVVVASLLALLGLAYNNVVVIVASMLVSPIMGPVVAVTFGTIIKDARLVKQGLWSELVGLGICVATGYIFGLVLTPFSDDLNFITEEMSSRGNAKGLISGILVAVPSGIGVALSILGNNTSSLVGVAISASLLPPAVNTGVLLAIATLSDSFHPNHNSGSELASDATEMAAFSFLITVANIIVIYIMALGMFKFKEVAPIPGKTRFWKEDVKMSRQYNAVLKGEEAAAFAERIRKVMPSLLVDPEVKQLNSVKHTEGTAMDHYLTMSRPSLDDQSFGYNAANTIRIIGKDSSTSNLMSLFEAPSPAKITTNDRGASAPSRFLGKYTSTGT